MPEKSDQLPPHAIEAERGLLGCLLISPEPSVVDLCEAVDHPLDLFYDHRHRKLAEIIIEMVGLGRMVDPVTLGQRLADLRAEQEVGGQDYWPAHQDVTPSAANLPHYVSVLRDARTRRRLIAAGSKMVQVGRDEPDVAEAVTIAEKEVFGLLDRTEDLNGETTKEAVKAAVDRFEAAVANPGKPRGLETGLYDLDRLSRGFRPGQLVVFGARPSEGKTALGLQFAERLAVDCGQPVGFWSLEMTRDELVTRLICSRARVALDAADDGNLSQAELERMGDAASALAASPLQIYDRGGLGIRTLCAMARRAHRKHRLASVIVDYCQLLAGDKRRKDSRTLEIGEITGGLKELAKELSLPVLLLSQLNREYDRERTREPRLSDLRDSGTIEQDADLVIMIHPKEPKDGDPIPDLQEAKLLVRKNRNGRTGRVDVIFNRPLVRFESKAHE